MIIESLNNNTIKKIKSLKIKKERDFYNLFIAEGLRFIKEIPEDWKIEEYIISQEFINRYPEKLNELKLRAKLYIVIDKIFKDISDTQNPQGIIAICEEKKFTISDMINNTSPFLLLIDEIQDPGNLGTIIRTADAAGVTGVIISKGTVDLYNSKVLRSTMGSIFHIPIIKDLNIEQTILDLKKLNLTILSSHLNGTYTPYQINLKNPLAIVVGNEANGITENIAKQSDMLIKLPMIGKSESLNVSIASGILLYEVVRQRLTTFNS